MTAAVNPQEDRISAAHAAARRLGDSLRRDSQPRTRAAGRPALSMTGPEAVTASPDLEEYGLAVEVVTVTPALAAEWLKTNTRNRRISPSTVRRYERSMAGRRWKLNGEPIIFDRLGRTANGQQRLTACVLADTPFVTLVVRGVDPEAFETMDSGKNRTGSDVLGMYGLANTTCLSSSAILLKRYDDGNLTSEGGRIATEPYQIREVVAANPGLGQSVQVAERLRRLCPKSILAFCHYVFDRIDPAAADDFFAKLETGADMAATDPVLSLRNRLAENRASAAKLRGTHLIALFFKAFNFAREGRQMGRSGLLWRTGGPRPEPFPTLNP